MNTQIIIQYLEIFGLTVFGLFFLTLLVLTIYLVTIVAFIKKTTNIILNDISKIISFVDKEAQSISSLVKNKITAIDIEKILFGPTILGGIVAYLKNSFSPKNRNKSRSKTK
ncbi:MAG: hypothetical protein H7196_04150 [candidate division SR1 bacterium]|nr:hypothetical protein [candidate division SR1 bacterium]